jgi:hypothetical protein
MGCPRSVDGPSWINPLQSSPGAGRTIAADCCAPRSLVIALLATTSSGQSRHAINRGHLVLRVGRPDSVQVFGLSDRTARRPADPTSNVGPKDPVFPPEHRGMEAVWFASWRTVGLPSPSRPIAARSKESDQRRARSVRTEWGLCGIWRKHSVGCPPILFGKHLLGHRSKSVPASKL